MPDQINELPSCKELIEKFAEIQKLSYEEAEKMIGAPTAEEILSNIANYTVNRINEKMPKLNRKQRRALKKKGVKLPETSEAELIADTAKRLNYIELITKLRELNERKLKEVDFDEAT